MEKSLEIASLRPTEWTPCQFQLPYINSEKKTETVAINIFSDFTILFYEFKLPISDELF